MLKKKAVAFLLLFPFALAGCSSPSETPAFGNGGSIASSSQVDTKETGINGKSPVDSTNAKPSGTKNKAPEKIDMSEDVAKEKGLRLDGNNNPYTDATIGPTVKSPEELEKIYKEAEAVKDKPISEHSMYAVDGGAYAQAASVISERRKLMQAGKWRESCTKIYLHDMPLDECAKKVERIYGGSGYKPLHEEFTPENSIATMEDKDVMVIVLKDKPYEESNRTVLKKDRGEWKLVLDL